MIFVCAAVVCVDSCHGDQGISVYFLAGSFAAQVSMVNGQWSKLVVKPTVESLPSIATRPDVSFLRNGKSSQ